MVVQAIKKAGGAPSAGGSTAGHAAKPLIEYTSDAFARAVADGKVEVICFYAEWDITTLPPKAQLVALQADAAQAGDDVVAFSADVTAKSAPGWERLQGRGQVSFPAVVVYGPGVSEPIVLYTHTSKELGEA